MSGKKIKATRPKHKKGNGFKVIGVRIDIESRSRTDVKFGAYRYTEDDDFAVLVLAYAPIRQYAGGRTSVGAVRTLDLSDSAACSQFAEKLLDPSFQKHAFNANFERITLSKWVGLPGGTYIDPENWYCSAVKANVNGVFGSLDEVARALRSPIAKDTEGKRLIRLFSIPDRKTGLFHSPGGTCWCGANHAKDFAKFEDYCQTDVKTEAAVDYLLPEIPALVQSEYEFDQRINDRGFRHHRKTAVRAVEQVAAERDRLMAELKSLTGLDNPNSVQQFRGWLDTQGYPMTSLAKEPREEALADPDIPPKVAMALTLKGAASLSSVAKHQAALDTRCDDGRIRGALRFYGAHTGREAGRGVQPQNLPRYEAPEIDRKLLLKGKAGTRAPEIAKGTVRGSIIPAKGHVFVVVDENAIEARVLGWLAGEQWVLDEFSVGEGKIYEATAATMFGVNKKALVKALAKCGKCGACEDCRTRGKGKVSNLALGYAGGAGALVTMGAEREGIDCGNYVDLHREWEAAGKPGKFFQWERERHSYDELLRLRDLYRDNSPATTRFWKHCAEAFDLAATEGKGARIGNDGVVSIIRDGPHNRMVLPSGRSIWYRYAKSHPDDNDPTRIDRRTFIGKSSGVGHSRTETHGGKLTENVTQAVARDVLFDLMAKIERLTAKGWPGRLVLHVHDEVVLEVPEKHAERVLLDVKQMMTEPPAWAPTLPVKGEGGIMERYGK